MGGDTEAGLDPVALTLALWLGLVTGGTALMRMAEDAAARAAFERATGVVAAPGPATVDPMGVISLQVAAMGG